MRSSVLLASISLVFTLMGCGGSNRTASQLFEIQLEGNRKEFAQNETVSISIGALSDLKADKATYYIDGKEAHVSNGKITLDVPQLGNKELTAKLQYGEQTGEISKKIKVLAQKAPEIYTYEILNEYPHDPNAYTQGLEFHNDTLYEGTGKRGRSFLRKVDFKTGKVLEQIDLDEHFFGEGITVLNNKIYQLTWQSKTGFIYDLNTFKKTGAFTYGQSKEGWGLCNDGKNIYKSDGSEKIWILDPETLEEKGHIETVTNKSIFNMANELEYVEGKIYANVYQKESMMIIDAQSGAIEGVINFGGLKSKIHKNANWDELNFVLNGVAYHPERKTFFVTGKDWDKMFEVRILKK